MAITFHPNPGLVLLCDFHPGFKEPEMVKSGRPVIVLTGPIQGRSNLVTIVPLDLKILYDSCCQLMNGITSNI